MQARRPGLEVSPGSLLKNERIQRQIRDRFAQPSVLELKLLQLGAPPARPLSN